MLVATGRELNSRLKRCATATVLIQGVLGHHWNRECDDPQTSKAVVPPAHGVWLNGARSRRLGSVTPMVMKRHARRGPRPARVRQPAASQPLRYRRPFAEILLIPAGVHARFRRLRGLCRERLEVLRERRSGARLDGYRRRFDTCLCRILGSDQKLRVDAAAPSRLARRSSPARAAGLATKRKSSTLALAEGGACSPPASSAPGWRAGASRRGGGDPSWCSDWLARRCRRVAPVGRASRNRFARKRLPEVGVEWLSV
jgi:hypothetical protein